MGEYLSNSDSKVRERSTLLLAELLVRLPKLPLSEASACRFAAFFSSRLGDYPSVVPALKALAGLLKNHPRALLGGNTKASAPASADTAVGGRRVEGTHGGDKKTATAATAGASAAVGVAGTAAEAIARGVFDELHLPALSQSIRQAALSVLLALVAEPGLMKALSAGMGKAFVAGLVGSLEGEKDPRCLIVGLSALRKTQQGFDAAVLDETCEAVFDATACYFPVTFTPPPNDPHNISPDVLKTGLENVLVGSPGMAPHVLPMLLDKLSSEVATAKEASLKALVAGMRAFGAPGVGIHLRAIGGAMFEEAVHGADPDLASLALMSLAEVVKETASHAVLTGLGDKCPEWRALVQPVLEGAVAEVAGNQPCSVVGRGSARVLLVLAASSALGLRSALALAVPRLLQARKQAAAAHAAMKEGVAAVKGGSGCCDGGGGVVLGADGKAAAAFEDAQAARLGALAGLAAAVDDKVDFSGSQGGAPVAAFVAPLLSEFSAALEEWGGDGLCSPPSCHRQAPAAPWQPSPAVISTVGFAARGVSDVITRSPVPLVEKKQVKAAVLSLATTLTAAGAWGEESSVEEGRRGEAGVDEGTAACAVLAALRSIGLRHSEYARAVLDTAVPPVLNQLQQLREASEGEVVGVSGIGISSVVSPPGMVAEKNRACAALVELSEIPGVFAIALSAFLAAITSRTAGGDTKPTLGWSLDPEVALKALDDVLKRGVKWGHHGPEILAFIRGEAPLASLPTSPACAPTNDAAASLPADPLARTIATARNGWPWGLPMLLEALDSASLSFSSRGRADPGDSSRDIRTLPEGDTAVTPGGGSEGPPTTASLSLSPGALEAAVSAVRTCTKAAPPDEQEALLSSLLSRVLSPSVQCTFASPAERRTISSNITGVGGRIEHHTALLPALAAVMGAVDLGSRALGAGGAAAAAVRALLSAALAEGAEGLVEGGGGWRRGVGVRAPGAGGGTGGAAPCCQCLATILNKLAGGAELDSAVALVVEALTEAFSPEDGQDGGEAMDVERVRGKEVQSEMGPVQCLAWTVKAVAMRGGLGSVFSVLLDLLCGLLLNTSSAEGERPGPRALAAAAAFGILLGDAGESLRTDIDGNGGGARLSPLWKQRLFVQAFPKLLVASRGPALMTTGSRSAEGSISCDDEMPETNSIPPNSPSSGSGGVTTDGVPGAGQKATCRRGDASARVPALLALLGLLRGVPYEVISQHLDTVAAAVVQALRSDYAPLRVDALETFQVSHQQSATPKTTIVPKLPIRCEAAFSSPSRMTLPKIFHPMISQVLSKDDMGAFSADGIGAMGRFRAVQCLTSLTTLPYSRLHPFKTQVTRRLRVALDDDRRAVRQVAATARNIWFLLG
ncbi:unnamed protein product [Scytosiphon promiscuus]